MTFMMIHYVMSACSLQGTVPRDLNCKQIRLAYNFLNSNITSVTIIIGKLPLGLQPVGLLPISSNSTNKI